MAKKEFYALRFVNSDCQECRMGITVFGIKPTVADIDATDCEGQFIGSEDLVKTGAYERERLEKCDYINNSGLNISHEDFYKYVREEGASEAVERLEKHFNWTKRRIASMKKENAERSRLIKDLKKQLEINL